MKLVYIAGPYRAKTVWQVEQNIIAAQAVAAQVLGVHGLFPICPHLNTRHMEGLADDDHMIAGTMELMRRCDAVIVTADWKRSAGTRGEVEEAVRLRLPVLYAWGDESWSSGWLADLAKRPAGYRVSDGEHDPFDGVFWPSLRPR